MEVIFLVLLFLHVVVVAQASPCSRDGKIGAAKPQQFGDRIDLNSGRVYIVRHSGYLVPCCGIISGWQVFIMRPGTIRFQIWRSLGTGEFQLIGENLATYHKGEENNVFNVQVNVEDEIPAKEGDFIGWYNEDTGMVGYEKERNGLGALIKPSRKPIAVGSTTDWSDIKATEPRSYAIQATISKGLKPKFKNLDSGLSIENSIATGTELFKLGFEGVDGIKVPDSFSVFLDSYSEYFTYNQSLNAVLIIQSPPAGRYSLDFIARDHCGNTDSDTLKIDVRVKLPSILNLPASVSVREDIRHVETLLIIVDVANLSPVACGIKDVTPKSGNKYFVLRNVNESTHEIYLKSTARLSYGVVDSYEVTVKCSGAGKDSDTGSLFVNVEPNMAPRISNLPASVAIHADKSIIGSAIYHVTSHDEESDPVSYNATCDPTPCPLEISKAGSVIVNNDVRRSTSNVYHVEVMVEDAFNFAGPEILVVNISGLNTPPFIYNLYDDTVVNLNEDSPPMTSIFEVHGVDQDVNDTLTFTLATKPTNMIPFFSINETTGVIYAVSPLNYESLKFRSIKLTVTASDEISSSEGTLKVSVIDINEAPQFENDLYTIYTGENKPGYRVANGLIKAIDLDKKDHVSYAMNCGADTYLFDISDRNAEIKQVYELDVDDLGNATREIACNVSASDKYEMTSYVPLRIVVNDENDNEPVFGRTSYLFAVTRDLPMFAVIGRMEASDKDTLPVNKRLYYHFADDTDDFVIDDNGTLYLIKDLSKIPIGTTFKYTVVVEDGKKSRDNAPMTVVVLPGNFTSLVTSLLVDELTFFSLPENVAWFVTAIYFVLLLIGLAIFLCCRSFICTIEIRKHFEEPNDSVILSSGKTVHDNVWNDLDKTGSRKTSIVSGLIRDNASFKRDRRRFRSLSLTPVLEISRQKLSTGSNPDAEALTSSRIDGRDRVTPKLNVSELSAANDKSPRITARSPAFEKRKESVPSMISSVVDIPTAYSHLSLSEIEATETDRLSPWRPWGIADFRNLYLQNSDSDNESEKQKNAAGAFKVLPKSRSNIDF